LSSSPPLSHPPGAREKARRSLAATLRTPAPGLASPARVRHSATSRWAAHAARLGDLVGQMLGHGTTLGCTSRVCTRARSPAHGVRRVHPVAGGEPHAAGAARRGAPCFHLQGHAQDEARLAHTGVLRGDSELGRRSPRGSARSDGHPCSSAGRWPSLEHVVACAGHRRP
jgi:hypothetical protein